KRLPEVGRTVGKGLREFRRATSEIRGEIESTLEDEPAGPEKDGQAASTDTAPLMTKTDAPAASSSDETTPIEVAASDVHATQPGTGDAPNPDGASSVA